MIRLSILPVPNAKGELPRNFKAEQLKAETPEEAIKRFPRDGGYVIVRCDLDSDWIALDALLTQKNASAIAAAYLVSTRAPASMQWNSVLNLPEGTGWRVVWRGNETPLPPHGAAPGPRS